MIFFTLEIRNTSSAVLQHFIMLHLVQKNIFNNKISKKYK